MLISRRCDVLGVLLIICIIISSNGRHLRSFNGLVNRQLLVEDSIDTFESNSSTAGPMILPEQRLPDCQVLIVNNKYNFHYEVLESILALYPLPVNSNNACNHSSLQFTVALCRGGVTFQKEKSRSWLKYANTTMMNKNYYSYVTPGQSRRLHTVVQSGKREELIPPLPWEDYAYIVKASCYCFEEMGDRDWLRNDTARHYCTFHGSCDIFATSPQAMWLNPHHEQHFFPSILPQHPAIMSSPGGKANGESQELRQMMIEIPKNRTHHNLCAIGSPGRREYTLLENYLKQANSSLEGTVATPTHQSVTPIRIHQFGWGKMPSGMDPFIHHVVQYGIGDYEEYQQKIATTCHAILSLIIPTTHPEYFIDDKKLSGSIVQAVAYRLPIVLHVDLARLYERYIPDAITHGNDQESFNAAIKILLDRLDTQKEQGS